MQDHHMTSHDITCEIYTVSPEISRERVLCECLPMSTSLLPLPISHSISVGQNKNTNATHIHVFVF